MSATELKEWMKKMDKTEVDIAAALKIHPITVSRFLGGKRVHRSTLANLQRYVREHSNTSDRQLIA